MFKKQFANIALILRPTRWHVFYDNFFLEVKYPTVDGVTTKHIERSNKPEKTLTNLNTCCLDR